MSPRNSTPRFLIVGPLFLLLAALSLPVAASEVSYEVGLRPRHVWRGITLRQFPVLSAAATVNYRNGIGGQVWIGVDLADDNGRSGEIQEIDLDLFYDRRVGLFDLRFGYVELIFPGGIDNTGELYFKARAGNAWSAGVEAYYNVDLLEDLFVLVDLRREFRRGDLWGASVATGLGWSGEEYARFFDGREAGFHHWSLTLDLDHRRDRTSWKLRLAYTDNLQSEVLPEQPIHLWGGLYLTYRPDFQGSS
ncbi:MAG: hypothetical protein AAF604_01490 [Acidobacteriota bacterium]